MDNSSLTPTQYRGSASFWTITVLLTVILIVIIALLVHIFTRKKDDEAILQCKTQNSQSLLLNNKQANIPKAHNDTDERKTTVVLPVMAVNTTQNPSLVPKPENEHKSDMIMNLKTLENKNDIVANIKTLEERGKIVETKIKEEAKTIESNNPLKK